MTTFYKNRTVLQPPYLLWVFNSYSSSSQASALPPYLLTSVACVKLYMMAFESGTATPRTLYDLSSNQPISLRILLLSLLQSLKTPQAPFQEL